MAGGVHPSRLFKPQRSPFSSKSRRYQTQCKIAHWQGPLARSQVSIHSIRYDSEPPVMCIELSIIVLSPLQLCTSKYIPRHFLSPRINALLMPEVIFYKFQMILSGSDVFHKIHAAFHTQIRNGILIARRANAFLGPIASNLLRLITLVLEGRRPDVFTNQYTVGQFPHFPNTSRSSAKSTLVTPFRQ